MNTLQERIKFNSNIAFIERWWGELNDFEKRLVKNVKERTEGKPIPWEDSADINKLVARLNQRNKDNFNGISK